VPSSYSINGRLLTCSGQLFFKLNTLSKFLNVNVNQESFMISENPVQKATSKRGFASIDPQRQKEIASLGGKAAHASGKAHEFNTAEAREAGRKGGRAGRRSASGRSAPAES
jgi:general stress protein YciG